MLILSSNVLLELINRRLDCWMYILWIIQRQFFIGNLVSKIPVLRVSKMISIRTLNFLLLITAFFYFVTCPTVHTFGEDIKHDLLPKIEVEELQKKTKKGLDLNFSKLSQNSHSNVFHHTTNVQEFSMYSSQCFIPNLSILSTIKLIL